MSSLIGLDSFRDFPSFFSDDGCTDTTKTSQLPKVDINTEKINPLTLPKHSAALAFIQNENAAFSKKLFVAWKTKGISEAVKLLAQSDLHPTVIGLTHGLLTICNSLQRLHSSLMPNCQVLLSTDAVATFSLTRDWSTSPIRCMAWHPHCTKLAVASHEDSVLVYTGSSQVPVIIRHSSQKDISTLAWRPMGAAHLAVGCALGVAVWTVDPSSLGTRPSASCLNLLHHQTPVNSIAWHPQGKYLASGSARDSALYIWNVESREPTILKKFRGSGYTLLSWSPSGDRLMAATPASVFRLWETRHWTADDWNVVEGHLQAAAWSPCGTKMIFADSAQPTLYCLSVEPVSPFGHPQSPVLKNISARIATVVADFTEMQQFGEDVRFGGMVQDLAWDPCGQRLAILFRFTDFIAVFRTRCLPSLTLFPCDVLRGQDGEVPSTIQFEKDCANGAVLTIAWSSGRVQHAPFNFLAQGLE